MSRMDISAQDLLRQLGPTSRTRSAKADLLFRRLRLEQIDQISDALARAPAAINADELIDPSKREKAKKSKS